MRAPRVPGAATFSCSKQHTVLHELAKLSFRHAALYAEDLAVVGVLDVPLGLKPPCEYPSRHEVGRIDGRCNLVAGPAAALVRRDNQTQVDEFAQLAVRLIAVDVVQ